MNIIWQYLDKRGAAINALKDYNSMAYIIEHTAKCLVKDVGRMDEEKFTRYEDTTRTAVLFALGYLYENRSNPDYHGLTMSLRSILFAQREGII